MRRALIALLLLVSGIAVAAEREAEIDRDFRKVERRLNGPDASIRDACHGPVAIEDDRPAETAHGVVETFSLVKLRGAGAAELRPCVRGVVKAGVVESWVVAPLTEGTAAGWSVTMHLHRARRDPHHDGWRRSEETDREAAARLTALWRARAPAAEPLAAEVIAPDLVELTEARWLGGNFSFEGTAADERFLEDYQKLLAPLLGGAKTEWKIDVVRPGDAARFALEPPAVPPEGLLRAAFRAAPPGALLRAFAELDRRDFVIPSSDGVDGTLAGGWNGIVKKIAGEMGRSAIHVGAIDVFAPSGAKEPGEKQIHRTGHKLDLDLESVEPEKIAKLLGVAGGVTVDAPAGLPALDVHLRAVPWSQALDAVAFASGCTVEAPAPDRRTLRCASPPGDAAPSPAANPLPPLERHPASALRVSVLATREDGRRWVAIVGTPEHLHVTTRTGVRMGIDGGHALVDEHGVSLVLERIAVGGSSLSASFALPF